MSMILDTWDLKKGAFKIDLKRFDFENYHTIDLRKQLMWM